MTTAQARITQTKQTKMEMDGEMLATTVDLLPIMTRMTLMVMGLEMLARGEHRIIIMTMAIMSHKILHQRRTYWLGSWRNC